MNVSAPKATNPILETRENPTISGASNPTQATMAGKTNNSRNPRVLRKVTSMPRPYDTAGETYPPKFWESAYQLE